MSTPVRFPNLGSMSPMGAMGAMGRMGPMPAMPPISPQFGVNPAENRPGSRLSVVPQSEQLDAGALEEAQKLGVADNSAHGVHKPFSDFLKAQVEGVNSLQKEADTAVAAMATGNSGNLHETMIALDKADVSFRMLTKVRNKVIDAYHEVMRMNI